MRFFITGIEKYVIGYFKYLLYKAISGDKMETTNKFNKRAFVSAGMFICMIGLPISGLMNHVYGFERLTVTRHLWMSVHNLLGIFFVGFSIWHIKLNWKPLSNSIKKAADMFLTKEALYAVLLVGFFLALFIMHSFHLRA